MADFSKVISLARAERDRRDKEVERQRVDEFKKYSKKYIQDLNGKDLKLGVKAAELLGSTGDPGAIQPLITALKDQSSIFDYRVEHGQTVGYYPVREAAARALVTIGSSAVDALIPLLQHEGPGDDWYIRSTTAYILGQIKDPRSITPLKERLEQEYDQNVKRSIKEALDHMPTPDQK